MFSCLSFGFVFFSLNFIIISAGFFLFREVVKSIVFCGFTVFCGSVFIFDGNSYGVLKIVERFVFEARMNFIFGLVFSFTCLGLRGTG